MDTLAISRRLREAGLDQPVAEAITSAIRDAVDSHAASKADLDRAVERLDAKIGAVEQRLDAKIDKVGAAVELKLTWWILGTGGALALLEIADRFIFQAG